MRRYSNRGGIKSRRPRRSHGGCTMTPRFARFLILICIFGCQTSPMAHYQVEELTPVELLKSGPPRCTWPRQPPTVVSSGREHQARAEVRLRYPPATTAPATNVAFQPVSYSGADSPADHLADSEPMHLSRDDSAKAAGRVNWRFTWIPSPDSQAVRGCNMPRSWRASSVPAQRAQGQFKPNSWRWPKNKRTEAGAIR